jgi:predicted nucleic acid-binding protein
VRKEPLLVDTDIFIAYLNQRQYRHYFESKRWQVYYSAVTKKELLAKRGLANQERRAIFLLLKKYRRIDITRAIAERYSELRRQYQRLEANDALIAASALTRRMLLLTGNHRHFRFIDGLRLLVP